MSVSIYEVFDRAERGKKVTENEFDLALVAEVRSLLKRFPQIKYSADEIVPTDDTVADQLFEAAIELAANVGLFIMDTGRVVQFSRQEILTALDRLPDELRLGVGKDSVVVKTRKIEDPNPPLIIAGPTASPLTEGDAFVKIHQSYIQEENINILSTGHPMTIQGREIKESTPMELLAAKSDVAWIREAMRRANRPGMPMETGPAIATTALAVAVALSPELGIRNTDFGVVAMLNEMKSDFDRFNRSVLFTQNGTNNLALVDPVIGGYAGPPEGAALIGLAARMLAAVVYRAKAGIFHPCHMNLPIGTTSHPMTMWVQNAVAQAMSRNSKLTLFSNVFTSARSNTEMILYEVATNAIGQTASASHVGPGIGGAVGANFLDSCSGLEARFMGEVARAVTGISRQQANEFIQKLLPCYVDQLSNPPAGSRFHECYDFWTVKPKDEWLGKYEKVKAELRALGVPLN